MNTVYLDNAATSFPKPSCVTEEVSRCIRHYCGNPGRSSHSLALASAQKIYDCRERLCDLFSAESPDRIIFTLNATYALNMAIKGILRQGDHVLISDVEHNAVYRPISALSRAGIITYDIFKTHSDGHLMSSLEICRQIEQKLLHRHVKMLICSHIPNICSSIMPVFEIGKLCRRYGTIFLLDASQSAGHLPIDMKSQNIDILCAPGHKGLLGIQGCGFMILNESISCETILEGGSGVDSLSPLMPDDPPERFEAGTLPTPAIVGLSEGIKYLTAISTDSVHNTESQLFLRLREMLENSPSLNASLYAADTPGAVMLFNIGNEPSEKISKFLSKRGICVRSGYHCAPLGHSTLGTPGGGAVRVSFGLFNKKSELDLLIKLLHEYVST